ncbi:hypothetical protein KR084_004512 [Drosophila pseudotakahashii]|nr:hypothetical protein KR084_004512 [Drosophila pseudotakahashii]
MVDWIGLLLRAVSVYCNLIGLNNFEWDESSGRVFTSRKLTLYSAMINIVFCTLFIYCWTGPTDYSLMSGKANMLHRNVVMAVSWLGIIAALSTLVNRWRQRNQLKQVIRNIICLSLANPQFGRLYRWRTYFQIFGTFAANFLHIALSVQLMSHSSAVKLRLCLHSWSFCIANLAGLQFFLIILFVRTQYQVINTKLRQVIEESERLSYLPLRKGGFMTRCCYLSDQLEGIAKLQDQIHSIVMRFGELLGLQSVMVFSQYYMYSVSWGYMIYSVFKNGHEILNMTQQEIVMFLLWCFFYNMNVYLSFMTFFSINDDHNKMIHLLEKRTVFASRLDVRLEESFESFQLQLACNPVKVEVMGMFRLTRSSVATTLSSIALHTILLIQCDLEYFR